jgi:hypothetical protein
MVRVQDQSRTINVQNLFVGFGGRAVREHDTDSHGLHGLGGEAEAGVPEGMLREFAVFGQALGDPERSLNLDEFMLSEDELERVRQVFVAPPGFDAALAALTNRLVVLAGPPNLVLERNEGTGRGTAALALAERLVSAQGMQVCILPQDLAVSERELLTAERAARTVFVGRDTGADASVLARRLLRDGQRPAVHQLRQALSQADSYLILVCDPGSRLVADPAIRRQLEDEGLVVELGLPPAPAVFERHMALAVGEETLCQMRARLGTRFETIALRLRTPRRIEKFARFYARDLAGAMAGVTPDEAWRQVEQALRLVSHVRVETRNLFRGLPDDRYRYVALTLSLFNGVRLTEFWSIYRLILERSGLGSDQRPTTNDQRPTTDLLRPSSFVSHFEVSDADLLEAVRGQIVSAEAESDLGPVTVRRVRFADDEFQVAMLEFLKENYHARLVALVPLLEEIVVQAGVELRIIAARALGAVGALDFERILKPILEHWRDSDQAYLRAAVGYALDQVIADQTCAPEAIQLLRAWGETRAGGGDRWKRQWTAAAAYKVIGQSRIDLTLEGLKRLGLKVHLLDDRDAGALIFPALAYSLIVLSLRGHLLPVLGALREWMREPASPEHTLSVTAAGIWIQLMGVYANLAQVERERPTAPAGPQHEVVKLLIGAGDGAAGWQVADSVAEAFLRVYYLRPDGQPQYPVILDILRGWVEDGAESPTVRAALKTLIRRVVARLGAEKNPHIRERFVWGLRRWRVAKNNPALVEMAGELLSDFGF